MINVHAELKRLLEDEQTILLGGNYERLENLANRKIRLTERLAGSSEKASRSEIAYLRKVAESNELLLMAAAEGFRSGLNQVRQVSEPAQQKTYSCDGRLRALTPQSGKVEQKF